MLACEIRGKSNDTVEDILVTPTLLLNLLLDERRRRMNVDVISKAYHAVLWLRS